MNSYGIEEHLHRFGAWAAARAASTAKGHRFEVWQGKRWIEAVDLKRFIGKPDNLPPPEKFDGVHSEWCRQVIEASRMEFVPEHITHGVAAKLINVYLKAVLINPHDCDLAKIKAIHPPIDRLLLAGLAAFVEAKCPEFWQKNKTSAWSRFDFEKYQVVIDNVRKEVGPDGAMWSIEHLWKGHQG